jgi:predicted DNA-binding transcriptional regulator YafY
METFLAALKAKKKVQFAYQSFNSPEKKIRRVHPYLLKEYRHRWYLIGKNELKGFIQTYGLDRLSELQILEDSYVQDPSFDPDIFFKYSLGITANVGSPEKIKIETEDLLSKYLISQPLHVSQEYLGETEEGKHMFTYFLLPTYELKTQLLGFGDEVKVLEPISLVNTLKEICQNVLTKY